MDKYFYMLAVLQLVFCLLRHCESYIWNYALSQTMSEGSYQDMLYHPKHVFHNTVESEDAGENETKQEWVVSGITLVPKGGPVCHMLSRTNFIINQNHM